ncbi:MAG: InlB B-repeat-containing protein, partial [Clostridia bacterium]|nr:InlB B-repeat-containing protein [Clostridia bacterium]
MKKTISFLLLLLMLTGSILLVLPTSAAAAEATPIDFTKLTYVARSNNGSAAVSLTDYANLYTTTATATSLTSVPTNNNSSSTDSYAKAYYAALAPISADSSYVLYLDAKNVNRGGYSGFVFAADADGKPYFVYGALNNGRDNDTGNCELRPKYGDHSETTLSTTWYKAAQALTADNCGQYKIVYEGLTATLYTKLSASPDVWTQVKFGSMESFTLAEGSYVAIGVYNRHGLPSYARTTDIYNASIEGVSYAEIPDSATDLDFTELDYQIKDWKGEADVSVADYNKLFTSNTTSSLLSFSGTSENDPNNSNGTEDDPFAKAYFSNLYHLDENSHYELYFKAKNNRTGGYCGVIFAADALGKPYFIYGALNNGRDNDTGNSDLRPRYGYHGTAADASASNAVVALDVDGSGYAEYKVVYEGYTVTVYAKAGNVWKHITFGSFEHFTLQKGATVAVGVYNRHGHDSKQRTASVADAKINVIREGVYTPDVVKYDANGGSGTMADTELVGNVLKLPECTFTPPTHKTFRGWSTSPNGPIIRHHQYTVDGDTTLYAIWKDKKYPITFDSNNGSGMLDEFSAVAGELALIEYTMNIPEGKVFKGWSLSKNGAVITTETVEITGATTFYAIWDDVKYDVIFNANNGTDETAEFSAVAGEFELIDYTMTVPAHKTFKGWALTPDGEVITTETVEITGATTFYAIWEDVIDNDDNTPPAGDNNTPPADDDNTPPADSDDTPPADDDNTPPADSDNTPPADGGSTSTPNENGSVNG